ncbi:hypothetical protein BDW71DRAFT_212444 [Aspergillus fruticulosus]
MPPFVYKNNHYNRRRPGFLDNLSNSEYTQAFLYIATKQPTFDSWKRWGMLQNNMTIVTGIISHLLVWFDANWTFPEKAAKERQSFQWDTIKIWDAVDLDEIWKDAVVCKEVLDGTSKAFGLKGTPSSFEDYQDRFNYTHWSNILSEAVKRAGPALDGNMAAYNNKAEGGERGKAWNSFDHLATKVNWKENHDVKSHRLLHTQDSKDVFTEEFSIMGAIVMYHQLKTTIVLTLKQGFPNPWSKGGRADTKFLIIDKAEWDDSMVLLQKYADILISMGWFPVLDDINEDLL